LDHKTGFVLSHIKSWDAKRWKEQYLKFREAAVDQNHLYTLVTSGCFTDFENKLRKLFSNPYKKENALQQLQKICQEKDTVDQHNITFQLLVDHTTLNSLLNTDVLIQYYANTLNHHIREKILTSETIPETLKEWYQKAAAFDNAYQRLKGYQFWRRRRQKRASQKEEEFQLLRRIKILRVTNVNMSIRSLALQLLS